jgi:hypothetical protein
MCRDHLRTFPDETGGTAFDGENVCSFYLAPVTRCLERRSSCRRGLTLAFRRPNSHSAPGVVLPLPNYHPGPDAARHPTTFRRAQDAACPLPTFRRAQAAAYPLPSSHQARAAVRHHSRHTLYPPQRRMLPTIKSRGLFFSFQNPFLHRSELSLLTKRKYFQSDS